MANQNGPATGPTLKFLSDLIMERDATEMLKTMPPAWANLFKLVAEYVGIAAVNGNEPQAINVLLVADGHAPLIQSDASKFITGLLEANHKTSQRRKPATEAGMYRHDGDIYKVQRAVHGSGKLYAKKLVVHDTNSESATVNFEYAPGIFKELSADDRLSLEDAREFGALYGTCCVCGRLLTQELSIALGIGPVCGSREFGGDFKFLVDKMKLEMAK